MQFLDPILPTVAPGKGLRVSIAPASSPVVRLQSTTNPCSIKYVVANSRGSKRHQTDPESQACLVPSIMPLLNHCASFISFLCPEQNFRPCFYASHASNKPLKRPPETSFCPRRSYLQLGGQRATIHPSQRVGLLVKSIIGKRRVEV